MQRTMMHSGRTVLAMDCVIAGVGTASYAAGEFMR
jgi:hypothetical protein